MPEFEAEAKGRERLSEGRGKKGRAKLPDLKSESRAREKVADLVGVSPRYVQEAKAIKEERPDLAEKIKAGKISISEAKREMEPQSPKDKNDSMNPVRSHFSLK